MRHLLVIFALLLSACVTQSPQKGFKNPDDFDPLAAAKTRISLGLTYLKNGNYSQAKFNLDKALQFAPKLADSHFSMAYYYQLVGENEQAEAEYKTSMQMAPDNADIINTYGAFLCQQGKYQQAKEYFLRAVKSDNYVSSAETYENLALCSQTRGHMDDAIEYLNSALNHQPGRAKSLLLLAEMLVAEQRWDEARQTLRRYEKVARVSAETLWMSTQIEQAMGNQQLAQGYGDMLIRMYPQHPYTIEFLKSGRKVEITPIKSSPTKVDAQAKEQASNALPEAPVPVQTVSAESAEQAAGNDEKQDEVEQSVKDGNKNSLYHVVQKDENLYRISLQYNIKLQRLIEWNKLPDASAIYVGKKLLIVDPNSVE
jgi:type IV pilus assembly protein PilF